MADNRAVFAAKRADMLKTQQAERQKLQQDWKTRTHERKKIFDGLAEEYVRKPTPKSDIGRVRMNDSYESALMKRLREAQGDVPERSKPAIEQDNNRDRDDGQER